MAIGFTNLGTSANPDIASTTDATSYANTAWTPPSGSLIVVYVSQRGNTDAANVSPSISGNNITWVQIKAILRGTAYRLTLFGADASGAASGATTVSFGSNTQQFCMASFFSASGVDLSGGVAAAFVQSPSNSATGLSASVALAAAGNAANRPIFGCSQSTNIAQSPRTNWTEADDRTVTSPTDGLETQWRSDAFETTASSTWTQDEDWTAIAAELKATVAAGSLIYNPGSDLAPLIVR